MLAEAGVGQHGLGGVRGRLREHGELEAGLAQPRERVGNVRIGGHLREPLQRRLVRVTPGALQPASQRRLEQRPE